MRLMTWQATGPRPLVAIASAYQVLVDRAMVLVHTTPIFLDPVNRISTPYGVSGTNFNQEISLCVFFGGWDSPGYC